MTTTTRSDIHRPSAVNPADYTFVGVFYQGTSDAMHEAYAGELPDDLFLDDARFAGANFPRRHTCDHCGAHFAHGAVYEHANGSLIAVGHICAAETFSEGLDRIALVRRRAEKAAATARKAQEERERADARRSEFLAAHDGAAEVIDALRSITNDFVQDVLRKFDRYGDLSSRQYEALVRFKTEAERRAEEAANEVPAEPVVEGHGITVEGVIVSERFYENDFGGALKITVKLDNGSKVFGTKPAKLAAYTNPEPGYAPREVAPVGTRVRFTANVVQSDRDETFGFFSRPRKAVVVSTTTKEA